MKKLSAWKIKIPLFTLVYFAIMAGCGLFKACIFLFAIISIHEGAHCLVASILGFKVENITVYPFGMQAMIRELGFHSSIKEIMILAAGPCTHLINPFIFFLLMKSGLISDAMRQWLLTVNRSMLILNMLLIYPLDGGRIMNEIIHLFFPYTLSEKLTFFLSFVNMGVLLMSGKMMNTSGIIVMIFIAYCLLKAFRDLPITRQMFYRFRLQHAVKSGKVRTAHRDIYKNYPTKIRSGFELIDESVWLRQHFGENSQQTLQKNLVGVL